MSDATEYSLWLTFDETTDEYARYGDAIIDLASAHDGAPVFEPHLTVVGGIDGKRERLVEVTRSLAAVTEPIDVTFGPIRSSTTTHRCVFRLVDPSVELFELYDSTRDALGTSGTAYDPHVSLIYSEMEFPRRVALAAAIDTGALPDRARLPTLEVVATGGPVSTWETVYSVPL